MPRGKAAVIDETDENQLELKAENLPPASPIGRAAKVYLKICDEIDEVTEALDKKKKELKKKVIDLLIAENRNAVIVDGVTFTHVHKDATEELRVYRKKKASAIANDEDEEE